MLRKYRPLIAVVFGAWILWASPAMAQQESLYSQYMFNRLVINPAYAGVKGHFSMTGLFRTQWVGFNDRRPRTFTVSGHGAIGRSRDKVSHGLGGFISGDRNGLLETYAGSLSYAFRIPVGNRSFLSLGLSAGAQQWTLKGADIRTDQPGDPVFPTESQSVWRPDVGAGLFFNSSIFYAGFSTAHLVEFDLPFTKNAEKAKMARHYFLTSGVDLRLGNRVVLTPSVFFRYAALAPIQSDLNLNLMVFEALWFGPGLRFDKNNLNDVIFMAGFYPPIKNFKYLRIGYAYDLHVAGLRSHQGGSHEIMLSLDFGSPNKPDRWITPRYF